MDLPSRLQRRLEKKEGYFEVGGREDRGGEVVLRLCNLYQRNNFFYTEKIDPFPKSAFPKIICRHEFGKGLEETKPTFP